MTYEELKDQNKDLNIVEMSLSEINGLKGLYVDGNIAIEKKMITREKACILAEELGHHFTSVGNILDMSDIHNRKQERQARIWAYNKMIGLNGLIKAFENGCKSCHEIAEYLDVTEEFLHECIESYRDKYGIGIGIGDYYVMFIPNLQILKII